MKKSRTHLKALLATSAVIIGLFSLNSFSGPARTISQTPAPVLYKIDAGKSSFIVRAFVGGLFSAFGHDHTIAIRDFSGEARITPDSINPASLQMTIKAASLAVTDKVSDSDRREIESTMREEVLETGKHPDIVFSSNRIEVGKSGAGQFTAKIFGDLTLHGVTRNQMIDAQVSVSGNSLRAQGRFSVKHSDYNLKRVSVAAGTIKVKEELKLSFDIVANKH